MTDTKQEQIKKILEELKVISQKRKPDGTQAMKCLLGGYLMRKPRRCGS